MHIRDNSIGSEHEITLEEARAIVNGWSMEEIGKRVRNYFKANWDDALTEAVNSYLDDREEMRE